DPRQVHPLPTASHCGQEAFLAALAQVLPANELGWIEQRIPGETIEVDCRPSPGRRRDERIDAVFIGLEVRVSVAGVGSPLDCRRTGRTDHGERKTGGSCDLLGYGALLF